MSRNEALLVFGTNEQSELMETLFQLGFLPLIRGRMFNALRLIRHERFSAVLIDRNHLEKGDVLEFILNVRDLERQIPIIVVGKSAQPNEDQALATQQNTFLLSEASLSKVKNQLAA